MNETSIKIPAELFALAESSRFEGQANIAELHAGPDRYSFAGPLAWEALVTNTGSALLLQGEVRGRGTCACARCLEDVTCDLVGELEGYFLIRDEAAEQDCSEGDDDDEPGEDEVSVLPADHVVDLEPLIRAALVIAAPMVPLCRDDCAGLCPNCGANLNEGDCGCGGDAALDEFDRSANPFAKLADIDWS